MPSARSVLLGTAIHMEFFYFLLGITCVGGVKGGDVCIEIVGHSDRHYLSIGVCSAAVIYLQLH